MGGLILGAGVLIHWMFASAFAGVVLGFAAVTALAHVIRRRKAGAPAPDPAVDDARTPRAALTVFGLAILVGGVGMLITAPESPKGPPPLHDAAHAALIDLKLGERLPPLALWLVAPLAVAALVVGIRDRGLRWPAVFLSLWAGLLFAGVVAWYRLELPLPPYRWAAVALGLPILAIAAGPWIGAALAHRFRFARTVGAAVAVLAVCGLALAGIDVWWGGHSQMTPEDRVELAIITRYLTPLPPDTPVTIVVAPGGARLPIDRVFSGLPPERLPSVHLVGERPNALPGLAPPSGGVVLFAQAFNRAPTTVGTSIGPGVRLLSGPPPPAEMGEVPQPPRAPAGPAMAGYIALSLVLLGAAGYAWTGLLHLGSVGRVALAPAVGGAMLGLTGALLARAGVRPAGPGALLDLAVTVGAGVAVAWSVGRRYRGSHRPGSVDGAVDLGDAPMADAGPAPV